MGAPGFPRFTFRERLTGMRCVRQGLFLGWICASWWSMAYVATIRNPTAYRAITGRHQAGKAPTLDDVMLDVEASQEQGDGDGSTSAVDQEYADIDAEGLWDDVDRVGAIDSTKFDEHAARGDFHYSDGHSSDDGGDGGDFGSPGGSHGGGHGGPVEPRGSSVAAGAQALSSDGPVRRAAHMRSQMQASNAATDAFNTLASTGGAAFRAAATPTPEHWGDGGYYGDGDAYDVGHAVDMLVGEADDFPGWHDEDWDAEGWARVVVNKKRRHDDDVEYDADVATANSALVTPPTVHVPSLHHVLAAEAAFAEMYSRHGVVRVGDGTGERSERHHADRDAGLGEATRTPAPTPTAAKDDAAGTPPPAEKDSGEFTGEVDLGPLMDDILHIERAVPAGGAVEPNTPGVEHVARFASSGLGVSPVFLDFDDQAQHHDAKATPSWPDKRRHNDPRRNGGSDADS